MNADDPIGRFLLGTVAGLPIAGIVALVAIVLVLRGRR